MNSTLISIEADYIRVLPSFADMLIVQRLGGRLTGARHAWAWPATRENAALLYMHLR